MELSGIIYIRDGVVGISTLVFVIGGIFLCLVVATLVVLLALKKNSVKKLKGKIADLKNSIIRESGKEDDDTLKLASDPDIEEQLPSDSARISEIEQIPDIQDRGQLVIHSAKLHQIGKRKSQQDSIGQIELDNCFFAVLADGMGGLSDGDKVSQRIVKVMLDAAKEIAPAMERKTILYRMLSHVNADVNEMLKGFDNMSGSTLIAVLVEDGQFHWISVGDSRIYFYHAGELYQVNREHNYEVDLLLQAVNRDLSFDEAARNEKRKALTSFIGMGHLRQVDGSLGPVSVSKGDRLILMSDGVFNTLSDDYILGILNQYPSVEDAAARMTENVFAMNNPYQDNFTAILIGFD